MSEPAQPSPSTSSSASLNAGAASANPFAYAWNLVQSNCARDQAAQLLVIAAILFPLADRNSADANVVVSYLLGAPLFLGLFIGLFSNQSSREYLAMPRVASFGIWSLLAGGILAGPYSSTSVGTLGLLVAAVSASIIALVLVGSVASTVHGEFVSSAFAKPAAFISGMFMIVASVTSAMGLLLRYLDVRYGGKADIYATRLIGRPEVFFLALPALALTTVIVARAAKHPVPAEIMGPTLSLFGLAGLTGYMTKTTGGVNAIRYPGAPFVFPTLLILTMWALSMLRGVHLGERSIAVGRAFLGALLIIVALIAKSSSKPALSIDGAVIGFALIVGFVALLAWLRDEFSVTVPMMLGILVSTLIFGGALITGPNHEIGMQLLGRYGQLDLSKSVQHFGQGVLAVGVGLAIIVSFWSTQFRKEAA